MQSADLIPGWTQLRRQVIPAAELNGGGQPICAPPGVPLPGRRSTGAISEYSFHLQPNGGEQGHLVSLVFVQATMDEASQTSRRLLTPGYLTCMEKEAEGARVPPGTPVHDVAVDPRDASAGVAARVTLHFTFQGSDRVLYVDFFDFVVGQVESRIEFSRCCSPFDDATESNLVNSLKSRVGASPLGS